MNHFSHLDFRITEKEITKESSKLKNNKLFRLDSINNEIISTGLSVLLSYFKKKQFNLVLTWETN